MILDKLGMILLSLGLWRTKKKQPLPIDPLDLLGPLDLLALELEKDDHPETTEGGGE